GYNAVLHWLVVPTAIVALMATAYTGFLFAQGLARDLWQGPAAAIDLVAQSGAAGSAALLLASMLTGLSDVHGIVVSDPAPVLGLILAISVGAHLLILLFEHILSPSPTRHHELATQTFLRGAYSRLFWGGAVGAGGVLPLVMLLTLGVTFNPIITSIVALLALAGGAAWEYIWVEAGQSVPLS
ncbi:MAG: NrfD/PsrC family molybdoenzyme membrane anchor subunit, partial [Vicinamibacterales bacterium]